MAASSSTTTTTTSAAISITTGTRAQAVALALGRLTGRTASPEHSSTHASVSIAVATSSSPSATAGTEPSSLAPVQLDGASTSTHDAKLHGSRGTHPGHATARGHRAPTSTYRGRGGKHAPTHKRFKFKSDIEDLVQAAETLRGLACTSREPAAAVRSAIVDTCMHADDAAYVAGILAGFQAEGGDCAALLNEVNTPEDRESGSGAALPVHAFAIFYGKPAILRVCMSVGADPGARTSGLRKLSPIHFAGRSAKDDSVDLAALDAGRAECVKVLHAHGADIGIVTFKGYNAAHMAAWERLPETVIALGAAGCDLHCKNEKGETPMELLRLRLSEADCARVAATLKLASESSTMAVAEHAIPSDAGSTATGSSTPRVGGGGSIATQSSSTSSHLGAGVAHASGATVQTCPWDSDSDSDSE